MTPVQLEYRPQNDTESAQGYESQQVPYGLPPASDSFFRLPKILPKKIHLFYASKHAHPFITSTANKTFP